MASRHKERTVASDAARCDVTVDLALIADEDDEIATMLSSNLAVHSHH